MRSKPTKCGTGNDMLNDLTNDNGYVALKWAAEDIEGWRHRESMSRTCSTGEDNLTEL